MVRRDVKVFAVAPFDGNKKRSRMVSLQPTKDDAMKLQEMYAEMRLKTRVIPCTLHFTQELTRQPLKGRRKR